jgi:hypothetical protein
VADRKKPPLEKESTSSTPEDKLSKAEEVFHLMGVTKSWPGEQGFTLTVPELIIHRGRRLPWWVSVDAVKVPCLIYWLSLDHMLTGFVLTLGFAMLASAYGAFRVSRIEPSEVIREV